MSPPTAPAEGRVLRRVGVVLLAGGALWVLEIAAGAALLRWLGPQGGAVIAAVVNALVAWRFLRTLRAGRQPLISRYAAFDPAGLLPEVAGYTRRLTGIWGLLLLGLALLHLLPLAGVGSTGALLAAQALLLAGLFLAEHGLRGKLFPQLGRVTPWRTLRAIGRATAHG